MAIGFSLSLITTLFLLLISIFNNKTKWFFDSYWFYLITSLIFLVYFITTRWIGDLKSWIDNDDRNLMGGMEVIKSKVLLLDMCPFNFVVLCLLLIIFKDRKYASSISYFGIIGGGITIYGQIMFEDSNNWFDYTFGHDMYFLMHFYLIVMSYIVLLNSKCFNWTKIIIAHSYAIFFFSYISIVSFNMNINWNVTGIRPNDWGRWGEYSTIGEMFNLPWPWQPILIFGFVWILINVLMFLRNLMVLDPKFITRDIVIPLGLKKKYISIFSRKI